MELLDDMVDISSISFLKKMGGENGFMEFIFKNILYSLGHNDTMKAILQTLVCCLKEPFCGFLIRIYFSILEIKVKS